MPKLHSTKMSLWADLWWEAWPPTTSPLELPLRKWATLIHLAKLQTKVYSVLFFGLQCTCRTIQYVVSCVGCRRRTNSDFACQLRWHASSKVYPLTPVSFCCWL